MEASWPSAGVTGSSALVHCFLCTGRYLGRTYQPRVMLSMEKSTPDDGSHPSLWMPRSQNRMSSVGGWIYVSTGNHRYVAFPQSPSQGTRWTLEAPEGYAYFVLDYLPIIAVALQLLQ